MTNYNKVKEFYISFLQENFIASRPGLDEENISEDRVQLKMKLIAEEFIELVEACFGDKSAAILQEAWIRAIAADEKRRDLVGVADALADLNYVENGLALEAGIPIDEIFANVHASNMSKLDDDGNPIISDGITPSEYDGEIKPEGKILKSKNFFEPEPKIIEILENAGWKNQLDS